MPREALDLIRAVKDRRLLKMSPALLRLALAHRGYVCVRNGAKVISSPAELRRLTDTRKLRIELTPRGRVLAERLPC